MLKVIIQPVCEAGDGEAEPGELDPIHVQPTKWATDETWKNRLSADLDFPFRQLRRLNDTRRRYPGSASPSPGASTLTARCAGWLNCVSYLGGYRRLIAAEV